MKKTTWRCACGYENIKSLAFCIGGDTHRKWLDEQSLDVGPAYGRLASTSESDVSLPIDSAERKEIPLVSGCLDYFPAALAEVARLSKYGNDKHNPGEPLHNARSKSADHADCIVRHLMDRGATDLSGFSHTVMVAWRALALLQEELEAAGAPLARGARL